jgi:hypothetical protein
MVCPVAGRLSKPYLPPGARMPVNPVAVRAASCASELTIAVARPMVHDLRAMCDAVGYVVKNGIESRALLVDFPAVGGGLCLLRTVKRTRFAAGPDHQALGTAARASRLQGPAHGLHRGLPGRQGPRHRRQGHQWLRSGRSGRFQQPEERAGVVGLLDLAEPIKVGAEVGGSGISEFVVGKVRIHSASPVLVSNPPRPRQPGARRHWCRWPVRPRSGLRRA